MMFSLGISAFGVSKILTGKLGWGLPITGLGLWLAALPRPHVAGLIAVALAGAYVVRPSRGRSVLAPVGKGLAMALLGALAVVLVIRTDQFLKDAGINTSAGVAGTLQDTASRTQQGGSQFAPSILQSPVRAPVAVVTVLFRPFVFEAHNAQALVAAVESSFLLLLAMVRFRWGFAALASIRRQPYVAFALIYTGLFVVAFSSLANFGLLARERVQVLPLFLVLISVPPKPAPNDVPPLRTEARVPA